MGDRSRYTRSVSQLELPPGVRLEWEHAGARRPVEVRAIGGECVLCAGGFPLPRQKAPAKPRGKPAAGPGLFDTAGPAGPPPAAASVVRVLARKRDQDKAYAVANALGRMGYAATAVTKGE